MLAFFALVAPALAAPHWLWPRSTPAGSNTRDYNLAQSAFKHVVAISIDGMHSSDVGKWTSMRPNSNIARLLQHGYEYIDAFTSAPSDSFPGTVAQYTGATPKTTGVWFDDAWDWTFYAPGSGCVGPPGANGMSSHWKNVVKNKHNDIISVLYTESVDYNDTELFSGGIDPKNLPERKVDGNCMHVYPHQRLRVNTVFEIINGAGYETAYADKHPVYDLVRGPSGTGLTVGYFPEIAAVNNTVEGAIAYDQLHVNAWLDWLDITTPANSTTYGSKLTKVPTLFGGNFQSLSVAQKTIGYDNDTQNSFSDAITTAMEFIDNSIGAVVSKLESKGLHDETLIVIASKHGQAPIERSLYRAIDPTAVTNLTSVPIAYTTTDDIALIFLNNSADTAQAVKDFEAGAREAEIRAIIWGQNLTDSGFGNPDIDPAVPNIIVQPELGVVYTTSVEDAEHGGISRDDRLVACMLSNPKLKKRVFGEKVYTTQVGPTILKGLGIDHKLLQGAAAEGTTVLLGF